ncbi:UDP-N-acetylmuramoyl-L-alanine--D-glutamate ligase [Euzebya sp.]|uniref:UDP-N-acetylmuramoyl-L-alanine--D-glutamate ligase n=1 Tax=Euzebya sp. TaxID=1971409 RepID=UPI0035182ABF
MPPSDSVNPTSWSDLTGAAVGLWGLGAEGQANRRALERRGIVPVIVDDAGVEGALATDRGGLEALARCDVVIASPGISRYDLRVRSLRAAGVEVTGGLALWLAQAPVDRVVCVTGSKGKSTTTSILGHLLAGLGHRVVVGGNLGVPPWLEEDDADLWVVEVSSYQAADVRTSPGVVAVTSLSPDHLTWHDGDVETYYADKLRLASQPGARVTVANGHDPALAERAHLLGPQVRWVRADDAVPEWVRELGVVGRHNVVNALIAGVCLEELGVRADEADLVAAARDFAPLESRLRPIGTVDGVEFIDDSLSTNVLPTAAAVDAMGSRPTALIAGGFDRGIEYAPLASHLAARDAPTLVLAIPTTGARIADEIAALPEGAGQVEVRRCADLSEAVAAGFDWARGRDGGVVLLSPAAASFDHFRDYRHRAEVFAAAMRDCAAE